AAAAWRYEVLERSAFVVVTRPGSVVAAETNRLIRQLADRRLDVRAVVATGRDDPAVVVPARAVRLHVPILADATGCDGLRSWRDQVRIGHIRTPGPGPAVRPAVRRSGARGGADVPAWLDRTAPRILLFAGKGGVGKST